MPEQLDEQFYETFQGIQRRIDPDQVGAGQVYDAINLEWSRPYGSAGPRAGSRSLSAYDAVPNGGHPLNPLGNANFDGTAEVLALVHDADNRRLLAIVRDGTDADGDAVARVVRMDLSLQGVGFDLARQTDPFKIDGARLPDYQLVDGRLFVATGSRYPNRNVVVDGEAMAFTATLPDPEIPPAPTVELVTAGSGDATINAVSGYLYRAVYLSRRTRARSAFSDPSASSGPFSSRKVKLTVGGADDAVEYDRIEIWRTTDGGGTYRFLTDVANPGRGNLEVAYDSTPDDRLSYLELPRRHGRVPSCRFVVAHNDRLIWLHKTDYPLDPNVAYYSEPGAPFNVDPVFNVITVGANDGAQIVGAFRLFNRVFVIKSNGAIYELADNRPESVYRAVPLINEGPWACVSQATIREVEGAALWLSRQGVIRFTGESIERVSTFIEPLIADPVDGLHFEPGEFSAQAGSDAPQVLAPVSPTFTNIDAVPEVYHFEVRWYPNDATDPNTSSDAFELELSTQAEPGRWLASGLPFPAGGLSISSGSQAQLQVTPREGSFPDGLTVGVTYYVWIRAHDGYDYTDWIELPNYVAQYTASTETQSLWGEASKFFAIDYHPADEYHLYCRRAGSALNDTRLVLDYRSLQSESGPAWRRDVVHATAAILLGGVNIDAQHPNHVALVLGDSMGLVWVAPWDSAIDHEVTTPSPMTTVQRSGLGTVDEGAGVWTLTRIDGISWPGAGGAEPGLAGQRVVLRDVHWNHYTAIIRSNTETTAVIGFWLEGRIPASGAVVDFSIGGMESAVVFYPAHFSQPHHVKNARYLLLRGTGPESMLDVELRAGAVSEDPVGAALNRAIRRRLTARAGQRITRVPVRLRGHYIGARLGTFLAASRWRLQAWGLAFARTEGRRI